ncbi:MAG: nucleoside recognition domain-containing protein [Pirellulales bacterium]
MLNKVWFALLCIGVVYGFARGSYESLFPTEAADPGPAVVEPAEPVSPSEANEDADDQRGLAAMGKRLNAAIVEAAEMSVEICIFLIGIMALWLGILNIAKDAGLVDAFARLLRPLTHVLFPEIPDGHPAQGAIFMNLAANMLGLDNAATPLGLKAMRELQELNPVKDTATNSMAMFLAINTSSVTLIPITIIGYRAAQGSSDPAQPVFGMLVATLLSTIVAILVTRWLSRLPRFQVEAQRTASNAPHAVIKEGTGQ